MPRTKRSAGRYTTEDIAAILGISEDAVRQRLSRRSIPLNDFRAVVRWLINTRLQEATVRLRAPRVTVSAAQVTLMPHGPLAFQQDLERQDR